MRKLITTGCPRSGTKYIATVLQRAGFRVLHEGVYSLDNVLYGKVEFPADIDGDISFMAAPFVAALRREDYYIVHLWRRPDHVIRSLLGVRWFTRDPDSIHHRHRDYQAFVYRYVPTAQAQLIEAERALWFYWAWNMMVEERADESLRVEDVTTERICAIVEACGWQVDVERIRKAIQSTPKDVNHGKRARFSWRQARGQFPVVTYIERIAPYDAADYL